MSFDMKTNFIDSKMGSFQRSYSYTMLAFPFSSISYLVLSFLGLSLLVCSAH